ncbi:MAG: O-antigen ligase family protein [Mariniblastus sp.]
MELVFAIVIPFVVVLLCGWFRFKPQLNVRPIPALALGVVIAGCVFGHDFFHISGGPIPITLDRVLLVGLVVLFGALYLFGREDLRSLNKADWTILALIAVLGFSTVTHDFRMMKNMPASRLLFFNLLPVTLYVVLKTSRLKREDLKFIAIVLGVFGFYLAATGIAEIKELTALVYPKYIMNSESVEFLGRGRGPFLNPVSNGIFQVVCFCCVLMWWPRASGNTRFLLLATALVISIGVYATLTRSVWLGLVAACGLFIWVPAPRHQKGAMVIAATVLAIALFPVLGEKVFSFKRDKNVSQADMEQSAQLRPLFVIVAWKMFQDQPIAGVGFGQYARAKYPYLQDPYSNKPLWKTKSYMQHNVFLAYVTETGIIGLFCLLMMLLMMLRVSWKVWSDHSLDLWARQFGLLNIVLILNYSINGMFHDVSIIPMQHMLMFFIFGLVNNVYSKPSAFQIEESPVVVKPAQPLQANPRSMSGRRGATPVGC